MFSPLQHFRKILIPALLLLPLIACQEPSDLGADLAPKDDGMEIYFTDTVTVRTATVLLDSVPTTGAAVLLAGRDEDSRLGIVEAGGVMAFTPQEVPSAEERVVYDSLVLSLDCVYSYGDTNRVQQLRVYPLEEELGVDKTYYNSDRVAYRNKPLGTNTFTPRPRGGAPLRIRLEDELGRALLAKISDGSLTDEVFSTLLSGIALRAGERDNAAILGFKAVSDSTVIRLHYHTDDLDLSPRMVTFKATERTPRFNQLQSNRKGTLLASLQRSRQSLEAALTGDETFLLGGIGLVTRLEFPYLRNFTDLQPLGINRAELVVQPVGIGNNYLYPLPDQLELYRVDGANQRGEAKALARAVLVEDFVNHNRFYRAVLTDYIIAGVAAGPNHRNGLHLSLGPAAFRQSVEKLVLGGARHGSEPIKLRLYYTRFRP